MSRDIIIQEGGQGKQLSVDKLRTNLVGGGTCLWVPEDEVALGKKTINKDGTYKAVDDDLYGYSKVTVKGIGKATGTIPSGATVPNDGNEYSIDTDASGNLTFTKVPSSIRITTNPDTTDYASGDPLDYTGIVVTAYDANGNAMGAIPFSELVFPLDRAEGEIIHRGYESTDGKIRAAVLETVSMTDGEQIYFYPFALGYRDTSKGTWPVTIGTKAVDDYGKTIPAPPVLLVTRYQGSYYLARIDTNGGDFKVRGYEQNPATGLWKCYSTTGYHVYYNEFSYVAPDYFQRGNVAPDSTAKPTDYRPNDMVTTEAQMSVPVKWVRPEDGAELETSFKINIHMD